MAIPIKSNNTQQGCNPISSNCVIWQGPNIPCINLCTGDSVSDVVAKMATELCELLDQTDISLLDLSCFNPLSPTPQNFRDVVQIIINKVCALENADAGQTVNGLGCPDDCEVIIAPCLQYTDLLGNIVLSLPLKDYVILIGNRICTMLTSIANQQNQIDALDVRVTNIENNLPSPGDVLFNVTSECVTTGTVTLQEYITALDAAFCELQGNFGSQQDFINAFGVSACVTTNSVQMANPPQLMGALPGWIASPQTSLQQIQNLWVAICDIRTGIIDIQTQLGECCGPDTPCPTTLPRPLIYLNKIAADNSLYFAAAGTTNIANTGIVLTDGSEWALVRFEGIVIPSANGVPQNIIQNIPNTAYGTTVDYSGSENQSNRFLDVPGLSSSISVTATGTFYWRNLATNQECTTTSVNTPVLSNPGVVACPNLPTVTGSNFNITPTPITCENPSGTSITIALGLFAAVNGPGVTNANTTLNITYNNTAIGSVITMPYVFGATSSYTITNIACNSTVIFTQVSTTQNGQTIVCAGSSSLSIPADVTP